MFLFIFSDRFRTAVNVFGDSVGCAIVNHLSRKELSAPDGRQKSSGGVNINRLNLDSPFLHLNNFSIYPSNHMKPFTYGNLTLSNETKTRIDEENKHTSRTRL